MTVHGGAIRGNAFPAMGTVVSLRVGDPPEGSAAAGASPWSGPAAAASVDRSAPLLAEVMVAFARWEARCSLVEPRSELSRIARGDLALHAASAEVRGAYALALDWRSRTGGRFTPHRGDGVIDLNGVVKALAVADAGDALDRAGRLGWAIDAGGDILVAAGARVPVGIADPLDRTALLARFDLDGMRRRAIATSGSAERGDHIWTVAGIEGSPFVQVSVAAADLVTADVLATGIVAGGLDGLHDLSARFDVDVLAVTLDRRLLATPGWPRSSA
ncbi:thiamine biosynthesis lipoprotein [Agromyces sp. CF514]|uniref:FAD:protein FMN transferase n=1 Tax=Agromyces sp. CF514 TaxID=1881031 RepID=UPI0008DF8727|nr:FAD:protein FMN transferase [Agromyces sp. CF514]SFR72474.1 thiamine biosynthesis lipoprotein [Agromyces sp. CF514]